MIILGIILILIGILTLWNPKYFILLQRERRFIRDKRISESEKGFMYILGGGEIILGVILIGSGL